VPPDTWAKELRHRQITVAPGAIESLDFCRWPVRDNPETNNFIGRKRLRSYLPDDIGGAIAAMVEDNQLMRARESVLPAFALNSNPPQQAN